MRTALLVLVVLALVAASAPAAHAAKARIFWVTGTTGSVTASEVAETVSEETGGQNDRRRIDARMTWRLSPPRGEFESFATLAVPFRAAKGSSTRFAEAPVMVRAQLTVRSSGETWVRNAPGTEDTSGRYERWSCSDTATIRRVMPIEVVARGGTRFDLTAQPATGFTSPADATVCTETHPSAFPGEDRGVSFGDEALTRALTIARRLTARQLRSRRTTLRLRQPAGPANAIDCRAEGTPVCTQTATASGTVRLVKQCRDGKGVVDRDRLNCNDSYPPPKR